CCLDDFLGVISAHTVSQSHPSVLVQLGDSVTLKCTIEQEQLSQLLWYKQVVGQAPRAILSSSGYNSSFTLYKGFRDSRFVMQKNGTCFNLHISKVELSDTATYYCGTIDFTDLQLGNGTLLFVKGKERDAFLNVAIKENIIIVSF
ncbi:KV07 protein, partial [Atractosteus spatula]|nr:KV07 protein [Atractosteus spatula]